MMAINPIKFSDSSPSGTGPAAHDVGGSKGSALPGSSFRWRSFWCVMLGLHLSALPAAFSALTGAWGGAETVALVFRVLLLTFSSLFFVLKIIDVPWLRVLPGWRSTIASVVVVAFLHVSVINRVQGGDVARPGAHLGVGLVLGLLAEMELRIRPRLERALRDTPVRWCEALAELSSTYAKVCDCLFIPRMTRILACQVAPRAPPQG